ncbi:hypothetical protein B296_00030802 [Ensete ventricosum]|uniref:Uncharacterized protein n=1 Tax=Ensete ventricosum TaxID=4639 RepID=A0A426ZDW0_ENSVE|nr:hypothetical protein B296_00030802 [Ensete ventricosum]
MRECCHVIRGRIKSVLTHRALSFTEHLQMAGNRLPQDEEADKDQLGVLVPTAASSPSHRTPKKSLPWLPPASIIASTLYLGIELSRLDCDIYVSDDLNQIYQQPRIVCCLHDNPGKQFSPALAVGLRQRLPEAMATAIPPLSSPKHKLCCSFV